MCLKITNMLFCHTAPALCNLLSACRSSSAFSYSFLNNLHFRFISSFLSRNRRVHSVNGFSLLSRSSASTTRTEYSGTDLVMDSLHFTFVGFYLLTVWWSVGIKWSNLTHLHTRFFLRTLTHKGGDEFTPQVTYTLATSDPRCFLWSLLIVTSTHTIIVKCSMLELTIFTGHFFFMPTQCTCCKLFFTAASHNILDCRINFDSYRCFLKEERKLLHRTSLRTPQSQ